MLEIALLGVLAVFLAVAARLLRGAGPFAHWVAGWTAAALAGFLPLVAPSLPRLQPLAHPLGTLYAALLLAGAWLAADRPVPRWWLPAALAFGLVRAAVAAAFGSEAGYGLGLLCEPGAVFAAAWVTLAPARRPGATLAERLLPVSFVVLAASGAFHLAWLAAGRPPAALAPLWVAVSPLVIGVQIQASGDQMRRRLRRELEQRVAERTAALAESEERYRAVSALATDFAFKVRIDRELNLTREWFAGAFARTLGFAPESLEGRGWLALLEPAMRPSAPHEFRRALDQGQVTLERRLRRRDGEPAWIEIHLETLSTDADGTVHILGSGRDVTALKRAEAERERLARHVERVQRLESLGILAGGIAHDFNNLLTVIRGSARLALSELSEDAPARARVERIQDAAEQAAALTEEMLAYAGKSSAKLAPLDVSALVRGSAELLRASVETGCTIALELAPDLPAVEADATGLRRILMNLVLNAAEALGDGGGRITVRTALVDVADDELAHCYGAPLAAGRFVLLEVRDDGCGMDAETVARIFEPFFTTRFSGRGLGMPAVLGIVQAHHGAIGVVSERGRGTAVRVLFPPGEQRAAAIAAAPDEAGPAGRAGSVLLVDDDEAVLELAREVLARAGFAVVAVESGRAAIEQLRVTPGVEAVVLDLAMPDMDGPALAGHLRALRPDLALILVTGFDAAHAVERFAANPVDAFVRKPWEPEELIGAVQRALAERTAAAR